MKKIITSVLSAAMLTALFTGCGGAASSAAPSGQTAAEASKDAVKIAVVQPMSHTSLDQIRDTICESLNASGLSVELVCENANGDSTALPAILEKCKADGVDIVVPIATSTAQTAKTVFDGTDIPVIFAAVSDPVAAGLTGDDCANITGVSNNIPSAEIVKLVYNFQPDCEKIGFLYTSSETNSVSTINAAKAYCDGEGIAYEETSIANLSELQTAAESLIAKGVDALYTGNDNSIASAMATYTDVAYAAGIPVYCGADSMVADGGFATIGVDYVQLGEQVADMVLTVANGAAPADLPYETLSEYAKFVNLQAVERMGVVFDAAAFEGYEVLVEKDGTSHF